MNRRYESVKMRTLKSFIALACIMLIIMWLYVFGLFNTIYEYNKKAEIQSCMLNVISIYNTESYEETLSELSNQNDLTITIFKVTSSVDYDIVFSTARIAEEEKTHVERFLSELGDNSNITFRENSQKNVSLYVGRIERFIDGDVYFLLSTPLVPLSGFKTSIANLFFAISASCLLVATVFSFIFSQRISVPMVNIAKRAKEISEGSKNYKFDSQDYSEVKQISDTLNYTIAEMKKSEEIQQEVISNVSHELKTPLTMIQSYAELIKDINGEDKTKREENLNVILEEVDKLNTLVNDMLDLSKMRANSISYKKEKFDLCESLTKLYNYYKSKFSDYEFVLDIPNSLMILADKHRIEQAITNLINNAVNYSTTQKYVKIQLKETDNGEYKLSIIDKGIGIAKEDLDNVFVRHFRAVQAKKMVTGSGIGLSIVKEILDYHELDYGVDSKIDEGSTFFIVFKECQE